MNLYTVSGMVGFCIDTIKLFLSWEGIEDDFDYERFAKKTNSRVNDRGRYKEWSKGYYKNFRINYNPEYGISLIGSISNFVKGKLKLLSYVELKDGIEMLGQELGLNLHEAKIKRIDLALNIVTEENVEVYSKMLFLDLSRFKRFEQDTGIRFESKQIQIVIYNKQKELKEKSNLFVDENLLRIEFRVIKRISNHFGIKEMIVNNLYEVDNYLKLLDKFKSNFLKIKVLKSLGSIEEVGNITPRDLSKCLQTIGAFCLEKSSGNVFDIIEGWDKQGKFKYPNSKARCRALFKELLTSKDLDKAHPLVDEIKKKVIESFQKEVKDVKERSI
ncbi:hypothetical protein ACPDHL_07385 [Myroides sp. C15-4]|uniref:hypothetical protein n=1 Tax=Myroides sp. C15-4 TaxID=3400532 RepID=UPI003D2F667F